MPTLQSYVENYVGSISDTDFLDRSLTGAAEKLIRLIPDHLAKPYAKEETIGASGLSTTANRILKNSVTSHASQYPATFIEPDRYNQASVSDSIYRAADEFPVYTFRNGLIFVYPNTGDAAKCWCIPIPTVLSSATAFPTYFPAALRQALIIDAAIQMRQGDINTAIKTTLAGLTLTAATPPTPPSAPTFTFTAVDNPALLDLSTQFTALGTSLDTNEDIELAMGKIAEMKMRLEEWDTESKYVYQADLDDARNQFQKDVKQFEAELALYQAKLGEYQTKVGEEIQRYTGTIQRVTQEIQGYVMQVKSLRDEYNMIVQAFIAGGVQGGS